MVDKLISVLANMIFKKIRDCILPWILFGFLALGNGSTAFAQPVHEDGLDVGLTHFYNNPTPQKEAVETLKNTGFNIAVPLNINDLTEQGLGDGSFQRADLDFTQSVPSIPETNTRIQFDGPITNSTLYSVVAGQVDKNSCPIEIKDTQIAFFDTESEAITKAEELSKSDDGYLVYVSPNQEATNRALEKIKELNCQPNAKGIVVNGATRRVTVDFSDIYTLLPTKLQQSAKDSSFMYSPKGAGNPIYLVNGRKLYDPSDYLN